METEGVIKFDLRFQRHRLPAIDIAELSAWRQLLWQLGLIGQDPARYGGLGFGNISQRYARGFIVSGSQTGDEANPGLASYSLVADWDLAGNQVQAEGEVKPSSESLTHAAIYELSSAINAVFHVHSPVIWQYAMRTGALPVTDPSVAYGTPDMAAEVALQFGAKDLTGRASASDSALAGPRVIVMGGHTDGVIAWGNGPREAGILLIQVLAEALASV